MLPSRYRGRYSLFIVLSLLIHLVVVVAFLWSVKNDQPEKMQDKTVTVTLKQKEEPKKEEPKKEESKKNESEKVDSKKSEAESAQAKQAETKKSEAKQAQAKQAEADKSEAKQAQAKLAEAKKVEAKKAQAKQAEAKKSEAKQAQAKQAEANKAKPKEQPITRPIIRDSLSEYQEENNVSRKEGVITPQLGSMEFIDDRTLSQLVVTTQSLDRKFDTRHFEGEVYKKELNFFQKQQFNAAMQQALQEIDVNIVQIPWDGGRYYGEINFFVDDQGNIEKIFLKKSSGSDELDNSMIQGLIKTKRISMPDDPQVRRVMHLTKKLLYYSDKDMLK